MARDRVPGQPLCLVEEGGAGGGKVVGSVSLEKGQVAALAGEARGDLGADVAEDDVWHPDVLLEKVEQRFHRLAPVEQAERRDPDPLLVDLRRVRTVAAGGVATDVGLVADAHRPADEPLAEEDGLEEVEIRQVRAALVRVVEQVDVARHGSVPRTFGRPRASRRGSIRGGAAGSAPGR